MKLLLLMPQLPYPAHQGTTLRNLHILRGLSDKHEITLLCFSENEEAEFGPLIDYCHEIFTVPEPKRQTAQRLWQMVSTRKPDMAHRLRSIAFDLALDSLLEQHAFDVVQIEGIELASAIEIVREVSPASKIVFDNHNAETALQQIAYQTDRKNLRRWPAAAYSSIQIGRLSQFERWAIESSDATTVVSGEDAAALAQLTDHPVHCIPNCIDTQAYAAYDGAVEPYELVFMGKMDYRPNVDAVLWFADEIWPLIQAEHPTVRWAIVGQKAHERLDRLRTLPGVTVTGWVESVQPFLHGAQVVVMPLRMGSGTRLKVIEALAAGKPVVSTQLGVAGFAVVDGQTLLIGDNSAEFAAQVNRLLSDNKLAASFIEPAQQFAAKYDFRNVIPKFDALYASLLATTKE